MGNANGLLRIDGQCARTQWILSKLDCQNDVQADRWLRLDRWAMGKDLIVKAMSRLINRQWARIQ